MFVCKILFISICHCITISWLWFFATRFVRCHTNGLLLWICNVCIISSFLCGCFFLSLLLSFSFSKSKSENICGKHSKLNEINVPSFSISWSQLTKSSFLCLSSFFSLYLFYILTMVLLFLTPQTTTTTTKWWEYFGENDLFKCVYTYQLTATLLCRWWYLFPLRHLQQKWFICPGTHVTTMAF